MTDLGIPNANTSDPKTAGLGSFQLGKDPLSGYNGTQHQRKLRRRLDDFQLRRWPRCGSLQLPAHSKRTAIPVRQQLDARERQSPDQVRRRSSLCHEPARTQRQQPYRRIQLQSGGHLPQGFRGLDLATFLLGEVLSDCALREQPGSWSGIARGTPKAAVLLWSGYVARHTETDGELRPTLGTLHPEKVNGKGNGGFANIVDDGGHGGIRVAGFGKYGLNGNVDNDLQSICAPTRHRLSVDPKRPSSVPGTVAATISGCSAPTLDTPSPRTCRCC